MKYYSTNHLVPAATLEEAVLKGLAEDNGLFMPEKIPVLPADFFKNIHQQSLQEISMTVAKAFFGDDIEENSLRFIVEDSLNFPIPAVKLKDDIFALELFHGPTLAFKDVGARFMARMISYFIKDSEKRVNILVATSGDTGSAVANGFLNVPGIKVFILYPSGMVSEIQEKQLTTLGSNIEALEIKGTFDDCQKLVKQSFLDKDLSRAMTLTSANSINIARLIPQSFYYFHAYAQIKPKKNFVVSVPSGNFGNLTAGLIAKRMGLPVHRFIAATNVNDVVPEYLNTGIFSPRPSRQTISNAMDVGNPSNFARMLDLYDNDHERLAKTINGFSLDDRQTHTWIRRVFSEKGYILDPHGAIGYAALESLLQADETGVFLETAHPAKFINVVEPAIEGTVKIPPTLKDTMSREKQSTLMDNSFSHLKSYLLAIA